MEEDRHIEGDEDVEAAADRALGIVNPLADRSGANPCDAPHVAVRRAGAILAAGSDEDAEAQRPRYDPKTARKVRDYLVALAETGVKGTAQARSSMSDNRLKALRQDPDFALREDRALEFAADAVEEEMRRRAVDGWEEPVFHKGAQVGTITRYSDRQLELLAKARRPEKFRESFNVQANVRGGVLVVSGTAQDADAWEKSATAGQAEHRAPSKD